MITITEMIEEIRERPSIILGRPSARNLYAFLSGFAYARKDDNKGDFEFLGDFNHWVHDRFRITTSQSWVEIIPFFSLTEADEMALFWKLLDEYVAKKTAKRKKVS